MSFIWNDKDYTKRVWKSLRIEFKIFYPMMIVGFILWWFFVENIGFFELFVISFLSASVVFTFFNMFVQLPHPSIPEDFPPWLKNGMYIFQFLIVCAILYVVLTKVIFVS